jgi:phage shock protein E
MSFLARLFGFTDNSAELQSALRAGALIIDVRTRQEYDNGHIKGSQNIPLNKLPEQLNKLQKMDKPIIVCCASGNRSGQAEGFLKSKGVKQVINGGGWRSLQSKIK